MKIKLNNILTAFLLVCLCCTVGCHDEKELVNLGNDIPTKLQKLYMVGSASPDNWDIDHPTPLTKSDDDPYIWIYAGPLIEGEFKLCVKTGTWEQPMFHSMTFLEEIGETPIVDKPFQPARQGGDDEKWLVVKPGIYTLRFNLRARTYSSVYEGEIGSEVTPIETSNVYLLGTASPTEWNLSGAEPMERSDNDSYVFSWTGDLYTGSLRFAISTTNWEAPMIRPFSDNEPIGKEPIENGRFVYRNGNPDTNWNVTNNGNYTITLNLHDWTISTVFNYEIENKPIQADGVYIFGDPVKYLDHKAPMIRSEENENIFTWRGWLGWGWMQLSLAENDWDHLLHPLVDKSPVGKDPIIDQNFNYPYGEYNDWNVETQGIYTLTIDLSKRTFSAVLEEECDERPEEIETEGMYIFGSPVEYLGSKTSMIRSLENKNIFTWRGWLDWGWMQLSLAENDWDHLLHPLVDKSPIGKEPVADQKFNYPSGEYNDWNVETQGVYTLTVDLSKRTFSAALEVECAEPPIETEGVYILGDPVKELGSKAAMSRYSENSSVFTWRGWLTWGWMQLSLSENDWDHLLHPLVDASPIGKDPVIDQNFNYPYGSYNNWSVNDEGIYTLTVDLAKRTFSAVWESDSRN